MKDSIDNIEGAVAEVIGVSPLSGQLRPSPASIARRQDCWPNRRAGCLAKAKPGRQWNADLTVAGLERIST
jgi:hypothetical protein